MFYSSQDLFKFNNIAWIKFKPDLSIYQGLAKLKWTLIWIKLVIELNYD